MSDHPHSLSQPVAKCEASERHALTKAVILSTKIAWWFKPCLIVTEPR